MTNLRASMTKKYIGDGVYVAWDGYYILVTTEDIGIGVSNRILFDNDTLNNFLKYVKGLSAQIADSNRDVDNEEEDPNRLPKD